MTSASEKGLQRLGPIVRITIILTIIMIRIIIIIIIVDNNNHVIITKNISERLSSGSRRQL